MWLNGLLAAGALQIQSPDYAHAQTLAMTNHWLQLYNLILYDAFKLMITKLFYFDLSGKVFAKKLKIKHFKRKLRHQVVGAVEPKRKR